MKKRQFCNLLSINGLYREGVFLFLIVATVLTACVKDVKSQTEPLNLDPHHITQSEALKTMGTAMAQLYGGTRTARGYTVQTLRGSDLARFRQHSSTRSDNQTPLPEDVLYIVNFENEGGFAVLAADDRIPPIIAITENGSLTVEDFQPIESVQTLLEPNQFIGDMIAQAINGPVLWEYDDGEPEVINGGIFIPVTNYVAPLLTTKWRQGEPYNEMCTLSSGYNAPTGCIAVATAQVMAYHKKPDLVPINNVNLSSAGLPYPITDYGQIPVSYRNSALVRNANILLDTITLSNLELNRVQQFALAKTDEERARLNSDSISSTMGIQPSSYITVKITWDDIVNYDYINSPLDFKIGYQIVIMSLCVKILRTLCAG